MVFQQWQELGLDRTSLVHVLNQWPELVGLTPQQLRIWKMLFDRAPEWVPASELRQVLYRDTDGSLHMQLTRLRKFLETTQWSIETWHRRIADGGACYRLAHRHDLQAL